jgi:hypothetical protein
LPIAILDEGHIDSFTQEYWPIRKYGQLSQKRDVTAEFSLIGDYYPNKTHNLLESAAQILRYQIENGPFIQDQTYSTMGILNIRGNYNYRTGRETYLGYGLRGDGVCGMSTALAHTLSQAEVRFDEQKGHSYWSQYWTGPLDPNISIENDTAISSIGGTVHDFKWTPYFNKPHYLSIQALVAANGLPAKDLNGDPNARIFIQLMLRKYKPDLKEELAYIEKLQNDYMRFNKHQGISEELQSASLVENIPWGGDTPQENLIKATYVEENVSGFEEEIKTNTFLRDVNEIKRLANEYIEKYPHTTFDLYKTLRVGSYIKESEWYKSLTTSGKEKISRGLDYVDVYTYKFYTHNNVREAIQCVGWVILLSGLEHESSPVSVQDSPAYYARDFIPEQLRTQSWVTEISRGKYKYVAIEDISDFNVGDLFVTHGLPFEGGTGHIGAIVGKINEGPETVLLVSDSNRKCDGVPRLFRVDNATAHGIFGRPPIRWVVIRKNNE